MELTLKRKYFKPTYTIGKLYVNGAEVCDTLEDKDRGLTQDMPTTEIYKKKVYGQTAIPKGRYRVELNVISPKFKDREWAKKYGGRVPRIMDVPGFDGVLFHPLNNPNQTLACIGLGDNKVRGQIVNAVKTHYEFMDNYLEPARLRGEETWLTIE